jgi:surface antigen
MKMRLRGAFFPLLLVVATASGCASTAGGRQAGGLAGSGQSMGSGVYITSLEGGLISRNAAVTLSNADRQRALEAEYRALEAAPGGQPVVWEGRGISGAVVAAAPYQVGSQNCRQYRHTVTVDGRETASRGAACRNANGAWTPLS